MCKTKLFVRDKPTMLKRIAETDKSFDEGMLKVKGHLIFQSRFEYLPVFRSPVPECLSNSQYYIIPNTVLLMQL